jgi:hypothetical protein
VSLLYKALAVAALIAAIIFGYKAWERHIDQGGYDRANGEWELKEAGIKADAEKKLATATNEARAREQKLLADMNGMSIIRFEENANHEKAIAKYVAAARAGALRLSVAIDPRSLPVCAPAADSTPASGPSTETRADLMPDAAAEVLSTAGRSAKDVHDFNAIIDLYNRARETCNAGVSDVR